MLLSATSHAIPVVAGEPGFGTWQRLIFFEMDEPKDRTITFHVFGDVSDLASSPPVDWVDDDAHRRRTTRQIQIGDVADRRRRARSRSSR